MASPWDVNQNTVLSMIHQNKLLAAQNAAKKYGAVKMPGHMLYKPLVVSGPSGSG